MGCMMKTTFFYFELFIAGILNGYVLIISLGYMHSLDVSMNIVIAYSTFLVENNIMFLGESVFHLFNATLLIITATPILSIFGFILINSFKINILLIVWISSIGILSVFLYSHLTYRATTIGFILDSLIIVILNRLIISKVDKVVDARKKLQVYPL